MYGHLAGAMAHTRLAAGNHRLHLFADQPQRHGHSVGLTAQSLRTRRSNIQQARDDRRSAIGLSLDASSRANRTDGTSPVDAMHAGVGRVALPSCEMGSFECRPAREMYGSRLAFFFT